MHPFGALVLPPIADAAGVFYTNVSIVYVPVQESLGRFKNEFGNMLALFETLPWGDDTEPLQTPKLLEKTLANNRHRVDQPAYLKARLLDMLLGDWDRHEGQWRWAPSKDSEQVNYQPLPRDHDQILTKFGGVVHRIASSSLALKRFQTFDYTIKDIKNFNFQTRFLDRRFANRMTLQDWENAAISLQQSITDSVIEQAVKQIPPELFPISGNEIIGKHCCPIKIKG